MTAKELADKYEEYDSVAHQWLTAVEDPRSDGGVRIEIAKAYALLAQAAATRLFVEVYEGWQTEIHR